MSPQEVAPNRPSSATEMELDAPNVVAETGDIFDTASSSEEEFQIVGAKRTKRAKRARDLPPPKTQRANDGASVPVNADKIDRDHAGKVRPPPPIVIQDKAAWNRVSAALKEKRISFTHARVTSLGIRVVVPTSADHRQPTSFLRTNCGLPHLCPRGGETSARGNTRCP